MAHNLSGIQSSGEKLGLLEADIERLRKECFQTAAKISNKRRSLIPELEKQVDIILHDLGMPYAATGWKGPVHDIDRMNTTGIDEIDLYFSPNKGSTPQTLDKIGSGGERSRLMLAIKSVVAGTMALPTLIFDEIDTGVSGAIAGKIGDAFRRLSEHHQLIAITHLPQVAAKGHRHFFVYKLHDKAETYTEIKALNGDDRVEEIAKMLSGEFPGNAALQTAKELMS